MAGVAGPMVRHSRADGTRFLLALTIGGLAAGVVLAVPVFLLGHLIERLVPLPARLVLVAGLAVAFAVADLRNRTPHVWRQVPQSLARVLPPGTLGLVWGFDLGLLFTTQKTVSLLWLALGAVLLLQPSAAAWALLTFAFAASAVVSMWSFTPMATALQERWSPTWMRRIRRVSGSALMLVALAATARALLS